MNFKFNMKTLAVALMIATAPLAMPAYSASPDQAIVQQTFAAPEDAAKALAEAVRANDVNALLAVVGPKSRNWLFSGDEVADRDAWGKFLTAYDRKNALSKAADGRVLLQVGDGDWAFPAPIVNKG
jgi:basic membrane lipoprotein Med (substrate-binding protein (PBP1-ABC) superfamily)